MKIRGVTLVVMFVWGNPLPLLAGCDFQSMLLLPETLTLQKRHREAELEYERLAAACSGFPERSEAFKRMVTSALQTRDYTFSLNVSRAWLSRTTPPESCPLLMGETLSLYGLKNEEGALRQTFPETCPMENQDELVFVKGLSHLRLHQWTLADGQFAALGNSHTLKEKSNLARTIVSQGRDRHWKSPGTAAGLSAVLPGSGYLYARRPQTAVAAFVVTGLFAGGTYSAAHAGEVGLATLLGLFSLAWYFGGVRGSAQAAEHTNHYDLQQLIDPIDVLR